MSGTEVAPHLDVMVSALHVLHQEEAAAVLLATGLSIRMRAHGYSMKPLIRSGSVIRVAPAVAPLKAGDILLYRMGTGRVVAHRLLRLSEKHLWTKGDACATEDERIDRSQVLGRVVAVEEPYFLPMDGPCSRVLGLFVGFLFPKLVIAKSALRRIVPRKASPQPERSASEKESRSERGDSPEAIGDGGGAPSQERHDTPRTDRSRA